MPIKDKIPTSTSNITRDPFPNSKKVYIKGKIHDIEVPMREIQLSPTTNHASGEKVSNPSVTVYDTSGAYTDPNEHIDVRKGLEPLRKAWIEAREDVEELPFISSMYGIERLNDEGLDHLRFQHLSKPMRAKKGMNVSQMHYAKKGIITPEMEYVAIRENQRMEEQVQIARQHKGFSYGANLSLIHI